MRLFVVASVMATLAVPVPARAQQKGKGHKSTPPSGTVLLSPTVTATAGATPFAWVDDASLLPAGTVSLSISTLRWHGTDLNEVDAPIIGATVGLASRVQLGASLPRIVGSSDPSGVVGGLGTTFVSTKVGVLTGTSAGVKLAVAPTIEILGEGTRQALGLGTGRTHFGLPVSAQIDRGAAHVFGSGGFFSGGVWFAGGGIGAHVTPRVALSATFSRAWTADAASTTARDRRELSGGIAFSPARQISLFGSLGTTIGTTDENGAGTTLSAGVLVLLTPAAVVK